MLVRRYGSQLGMLRTSFFPNISLQKRLLSGPFFTPKPSLAAPIRSERPAITRPKWARIVYKHGVRDFVRPATHSAENPANKDPKNPNQTGFSSEPADLIPLETRDANTIWNLVESCLNKAFDSSLGFQAVRDYDKEISRSLKRRFMNAIRAQLNEPKVFKTAPMASFFNPSLQQSGQLITTILTDPPKLDSVWAPEVHTKRDSLSFLFQALISQEIQRLVIGAKQIHQEPGLDYSRPEEWYPQTRRMKRKIIMHVGPTNSGKTYHALKLLENAKVGYYAGPLRLLAREIYENFLNKGIRCNLITGEEVIPNIDEFGNVAGISSGTIEMIPTNKKMDVCIIDEIQMILDDRRGEAWTNALLGVQAREVYCCGEASAVPLVEAITKLTGDEFEVKEYQRLGELQSDKAHVADFTDLKAGDCVVAFSKLKILTYKREIEYKTNFKVGVVYGALPPEVRALEAAKFNSGEYDILVASDAIGMGLNLKIKRVVFTTTQKFDGTSMKTLTNLQVKQIAGRAGRYSSVGKLVGIYTTMDRRDLRVVKDAMKAEIVPLVNATVWPTQDIWLKYVTDFSSQKDLSDIISYLSEEALSKQKQKQYQQQKQNLDVQFVLTSLDTRKEVFSLMRKLSENKLPFETQYRLLMVPINLLSSSENIAEKVLLCFDAISSAKLKDSFKLSMFIEELLIQETTKKIFVDQGIAIVSALEEMHRLDLLFMWLLQRWPTIFIDKEGALDMKTLLEQRITDELINLKEVRQSTRRDPNGGQRYRSDQKSYQRGNEYNKQFRGGFKEQNKRFKNAWDKW